METSCKLCSQPIPNGLLAFCCAGCRAVYTILEGKKQLENFREQPVFKQALASGLISNPALLKEKNLSETVKLHLEIGEMWCPSCAEVIRLFLLQEKGVKEACIDYTTDLGVIEYAPRLVSKEQLLQKIAALGYRPELLQDAVQAKVSGALTLRFIIAAFCALNVMMFAYPLYSTYFHADQEAVGPLFAWISCLVSLPVVTYCGWPILRRFFNGLRVGIWGMEALVVMGVSAALFLSLYELWSGGTRVYFDSMTVVIAFVLLGRIIETKAKFSAKETLLRLVRSLPRRGRKRLPDGSERFVPIKEIVTGDQLVVLAGEKIVLDGQVIEGQGSCNEALMTGESLPIEKKASSRLLGGTILLQGWLLYGVSATLEESALKSIIRSVEQEMEHKATYVRPVDHIVRWFVPLVLLIAVLPFFVFDPSTALLRAIAVLLISCPCAIGIAAPLAEAHLMNRLADMGVIVRNRAALQYLGRETCMIFDKTGTVTKGEFTVQTGLESLTEEQKAILQALVERSNHPVAVALSRVLPPAHPLDRVEEIVGQGMQGYLGADLYQVGSEILLNQKLKQNVYFAKNGQILAQITLGDTVRQGMPELIQKLPNTVLLSGDSETSVTTVAKQCHFQQFYWRLNPLQKREFILAERAKGHIVCMVGDGINDAPALTAAHVGISVVNAADISIHVSDLLLTSDRFDPTMRILATKGRRIIQQNLFWAFIYNAVGIGFAVCGALSPLFAAGAMVTSSLIVTLNAQRLKH